MNRSIKENIIVRKLIDKTVGFVNNPFGLIVQMNLNVKFFHRSNNKYYLDKIKHSVIKLSGNSDKFSELTFRYSSLKIKLWSSFQSFNPSLYFISLSLSILPRCVIKTLMSPKNLSDLLLVSSELRKNYIKRVVKFLHVLLSGIMHQSISGCLGTVRNYKLLR